LCPSGRYSPPQRQYRAVELDFSQNEVAPLGFWFPGDEVPTKNEKYEVNNRRFSGAILAPDNIHSFVEVLIIDGASLVEDDKSAKY